MSMLAIKGHPTRGSEIITLLKMLGGKEKNVYRGTEKSWVYTINEEGLITCDLHCNRYVVYSLEEFLEKFPYKLNELVLCNDGLLGIITKMEWDCEKSDMKYHISFNTSIYNKWYDSKNIKFISEKVVNKAVFDANAQCCNITNHIIKEETMEEIKIDIPKGYEFAGVDKHQVVFSKIQLQYPRTYEECHELRVQWKGYDCNPNSELILCEAPIHDFCKLIVARNIYWKIYGKQMGLGKSWEPNYKDGCIKYAITVAGNEIYTDVSYIFNHILIFPTEEMRDAFLKNFKDLIDKCKELL